MSFALTRQNQKREKRIPNPFCGMIPGRPEVGAVDADSRIRMVQSFSIDQCTQALHVKGIQKTVALAIVRRVRKIKLEEKNAG